MKIVCKVLDKICWVARMFCALLLGVILVVALIEIVRRYIFGMSFTWADELTRYCIAAVAIIGGASCYNDVGGLVSFDLLQTHLHGKMRLLLEIVINTVVIVFSIYMLRKAIATTFTPSILKQTSIGLGISMAIPYSAIIIGLSLLILLAAVKYYKVFDSYKNKEYEKVPAQTEGNKEEEKGGEA